LAAPCVFKVEPPGDDEQVHIALLTAGAQSLGMSTPSTPAPTELRHDQRWFAGFTLAMQQIEQVLQRSPWVRAVNDPQDILTMTDKVRCQQHLAQHGLAVARFWPDVLGYEHLRALMQQQGLDRVFLKARFGSSAAGVLAYRRNGRGQEQATTTAHLQADRGSARWVNVKRVRSYHRAAEVRAVVDMVAQQGAYAEAWLPKPRKGTGHFDVRVLTLGGRAAHRVARLGRRMLTNLHLDSERADPSELLSAEGLQRLLQMAETAAQSFPRSQVIGFDLVARDAGAHVLEANAFGDLLPGLLWKGQDSYSAASCLRFQQ
jgi:glutathione synthase/RimK-type ligase-like ATP-grasp enzyme